MHMLISRFFLAVALLQIFFSNVMASDNQEEDSFFLLRTVQIPGEELDEEEKKLVKVVGAEVEIEAGVEAEACHYYDKKCEITFKGDTVYSSEYDSFNTDIDKQLDFVTACS